MREEDLRAVLTTHGEARIRAVVASFYRGIPRDPVLGPMYPADDLAGAEARLADFLVYRLGGPPTYLATRGHPRLRMRHAPFRIDAAARDRWLERMTDAIEAELPPGPERETLRTFLTGVADFLTNTR